MYFSVPRIQAQRLLILQQGGLQLALLGQRAGQVCMRDGIVWIDKMLDKRSVIQLYSHAGVFCCPSIYEPFGIINLEAMACETAVVASKVGGIK